MKRTLLAALVLMALAGAVKAEETLVVYNWSEYVPEGVLEEFTKETGIKVEYSTYENNEVMYSKLKLQKGKGYDIVVPSTYLVSLMREEGLLHEIDHSKLSNIDNLSPDLMDKPYDPGNRYSIPYLWGSTGIGVNASEIDPATITKWADLWDPKWKGKLLLTDDVREVFHMALKKNGFSTNTTDPDQISIAFEDLKKLMPNVLVFNADAPREPFLAGDVNLGMIWSGEVIMAQEENPEIRYIYPAEGAGFWVDSFAIPAGAANLENAHRFIDFMLRPDIAARAVEELGYSTPNSAAKELLGDEIRNNPVIFPSPESIESGEFQQDLGDAMEIYNGYWEKLKTGS